jgi:hypothetical protein
MNIADKDRLYAGFARAVRREGLLVTQEPMAGPVQPVIYPVMWARDELGSFLRTPDEMRAVMETAGFRVRDWQDVTTELPGPTVAAPPPHYGPRLIMGDALEAIVRAQERNRSERRILMIQAVLERC